MGKRALIKEPLKSTLAINKRDNFSLTTLLFRITRTSLGRSQVASRAEKSFKPSKKLQDCNVKFSALHFLGLELFLAGSCYKRQNPQAPTPQAQIRNRQTRKVANAKGLNRNTNLT